MRIKSIEGIKGICAFLIAFTFHYYCSFGKIPGETWLNGAWIDWASLCVEIFFVISGFVICLHYETLEISFKEFFTRRLRKIYPIYLATTLVTAGLVYLSHVLTGNHVVSDGIDFYHLLINILLIGSGWVEQFQSFNSPLWYVQILCICWGLFFVIKRFAKDNTRIYIYCGVSLVCG